ncbi:MAG: GGDEF domain-containing protein [Bacillota bacterium]
MKLFRTVKWDIYKVLIILFLCSLVVLGLYMVHQNQILKVEQSAIEFSEKINAGVQRVSKLELEGTTDTKILEELKGYSQELETIVNDQKYFRTDPEMKKLVGEFIEELYVFEEAVYEFRETDVRIVFFQVSERNYEISFDTMYLMNVTLENTANLIKTIEQIIVAIVVIIVLLMIRILFAVSVELEKNKKLSKEMLLDVSTGLYNRSKCQEILEGNVPTEKEVAIIIFDLNDLKKTNDEQGHIAGDRLIVAFADQLKKAATILPYEIFLGRYGGDEFMAYFSACEEKEVQLYLNEVDILLEEYNKTGQSTFALSCAAGYFISRAETKHSLTLREIFDAADEEMYKNKVEMKAKKNRELLSQGIEQENVLDERLL